MIACVWEREKDLSSDVGWGGAEGGRLELYLGAQYVSPCLPPQSCFHKEIYKTGLWCASLPCIISKRV